MALTWVVKLYTFYTCAGTRQPHQSTHGFILLQDFLADEAGHTDVQYNGLINTEIVFVLVKYQIISAPRENF